MKFLIFILIIVGSTLLACNTFDSEKGRNDKSNRKRQANAIIKNKVLLNKSYQQVLELLGPEDLNFERNETPKGNFKIEYIIGTVWIDFDRLAIRFKQGVVDSVFRYHD